MNLRIKFFFSAFILSLIFSAGINILEKNLTNFLFWHEISRKPEIFAAQVSLEQKLQEIKPIKKANSFDLEINAKSAISILVNDKKEEKILFEKNINEKLPIASLTKLMTALIVLDNYNFNEVITVSSEATELPGNGANRLEKNSEFKVKDLFNLMLIESNNTAAFALAELIDRDNFINLMNQKAKEIGLENTSFINSTGLDSKNTVKINKSTALELSRLAKFILFEEPLILDVLKTEKLEEFNAENTNQLLGKIPLIIGGKTGETPKAGSSLLLIIEAPKNKGYLINVILNSQDRFNETEKLINWLKTSYQW